jgi:hypothetical protein
MAGMDRKERAADKNRMRLLSRSAAINLPAKIAKGFENGSPLGKQPKAGRFPFMGS